MTAALLTPDPQADPTAAIARLRERMRGMEDGLARPELDALPGLSQVIRLRVGGSYQVDSASLALALMAGPSRGGAWCAAVGLSDFGAEAAAELGVVLERTILVPDPGEAWLEATAALVDVTSLVLVRPTGRVSEAAAAKLSARLRKRGAALVSLGAWPRAEASVSLVEPQWVGTGRGEGHLRSRRVVLEVRRGSAPPRRTALLFPGPEGVVAPGPARWAGREVASRAVESREVG
ncbi:hypothetical protein P5P86_14370 [Nocardioides sp. BP30]|uniref:hypothetical protein n=1 Tax=Nocardioides sp. BP30 TaxID=3036374 RepID=UPI002469A92D|nr:hypothetical protein [Nocardioides sp. BP30]WGL51143.1 hypothetical protein P5P86_14370 [Nocardioides sp. BP30]